MSGWIKLHRKIKDSAIWSDSQAVHLWVHLLLKVNHAPKEVIKGETVYNIKRGQTLTGRKVLSAETGINESKIQRLLKLFVKCKMIEQQTNNANRLVSVLNYESYQVGEQQTNNERTTNEQQTNTNKNDNNYKQLKTIEVRTAEFRELIKTNWERLGGDKYLNRDEVNKFWGYWCEKSERGKKMRFEMAKNQPFDMGRRLGTWKGNNNNGAMAGDIRP
jgi:hypothetical protein